MKLLFFCVFWGGGPLVTCAHVVFYCYFSNNGGGGPLLSFPLVLGKMSCLFGKMLCLKNRLKLPAPTTNNSITPHKHTLPGVPPHKNTKKHKYHASSDSMLCLKIGKKPQCCASIAELSGLKGGIYLPPLVEANLQVQ